MKRLLVKVFLILILLYTIFCGFFYCFQEKFIFHPTKLDKDYTHKFNWDFEEINIRTNDKKSLNGLLFKADSTNSTKGVIFYLHGNAGALNTWGNLSTFYTEFGYDIFFLDYRGFGKSEGNIDNQAQLLEDIQISYDEIKKRYNENKIIILGYSIGTGPASYLASTNNSHLLILQAPYYKLTNVIQDICPIIPEFIIKYKLETIEYIQKCKCPIVIFHGDADNVINHKNSVMLSKKLKSTDRFVTLNGIGHHYITDNEEYKVEMYRLLTDRQNNK